MNAGLPAPLGSLRGALAIAGGVLLLVLLAATFAAGWRVAAWRAAAELATVQREHAEQVADWNRLAAAGHERALALLEQRTSANQKVTADYEARLAAARDRDRTLSAQSGRMRDQLAAALSAPCGAGADPAAGPAPDAAAAAGRELLGQLDRLAEESSRAADALADQVAGLQLYVRTVCLATEGALGSPETGLGALRPVAGVGEGSQ